MRFDDFAAPGSHTSDANGRIQFLVPLHELDLQSPYQLRRPGERGIWATNERLQIGARASQVIQQRWIDAGERSQLPNTEKKYDFTLLDEAGRGVADLTVIAWDAIDSCGIPSHPVSMPSDSAGLATATFAMPETEFIYLAKDVDAEEIYRLSEADIEILAATGKFTVRLPDKNL